MLLEHSFYIPKEDERLSQGSVLTDVVYRYTTTIENEIRIEEIVLPYLVVVNQACDLQQDYNDRNSVSLVKDKHLTSIVGIPAFLSEDVKLGQHLAPLNLQMRTFTVKEWRHVEKNEIERYYHIKESEALELPSLTLDFKHLYSFKYEELQNFIRETPGAYKCRINYFYREELSRRFTNYMSRIAIPDEIT